MTNPVHYINRESDGTTYWHTDDGWMAAPTQTDGTPDLYCASYVVDFEEYASREDYGPGAGAFSTELAAWLRTKLCEGGDGCDDKATVRPYSVTIANKDHTVHYCDDCAHLIRRGWLPDVKLVEGGAA
jgi:hypothetical protein